MSATTTEKATAAADFATEVVTRTPVHDVALPGGAGTLALVTLDNGFDHTKPNTFGPQSIAGLTATVARLRERAEAGEIVAVAVTGKPFIFAVGADLTGVPFIGSRDQALEIARAGHAAYAAFSDLPVPTFAFVNGAAMGGGVELALSATYRTMSAGVPAVALPEVFLGLVPGWGGCWMLPNLVGIEKAITVVIDNPLSQNRMLKGVDAYRLGMADALFEPADFLEESIAWAARVLSGEVTVERPEVDRDETAWNAAIAKAKGLADVKTGRQARSPYAALDLLAAARTATREEGFAAEDEVLADLLMSDELRAGLYAFDLVQKRAKRPAGAPDKSLARQVTKVGIVGAGLMASQLALLFIQRLQVPVVLTDIDDERVAKGVGYVHAELDKLAGKGRLNPDKLNRYKALVTGSTSKDGFADADFVIEAVFEEMSVKQQVFAEVEAVVSAECVLATNTSSLSIAEMASTSRAPRARRRLPLLQPGRRHAAARDHPGRAHRRRHSRNGVRRRQGAEEDVHPRRRPAVVHRQPPPRPLHGRGREDPRRGHADRGRRPGLRRSRADAALRPHRARRAGHRAAQRRDAREGLPRPLLRLADAPADRRGRQARLLRPELGPSGARPRGRRAHREAGRAGRARPRPGARSACSRSWPTRRAGCSTRASRRPRWTSTCAMITGAGFQFWNGGITPLLDRTGVAEAVTGSRFLPVGVANARA